MLFRGVIGSVKVATASRTGRGTASAAATEDSICEIEEKVIHGGRMNKQGEYQMRVSQIKSPFW
jgi:hypothetical protein